MFHMHKLGVSGTARLLKAGGDSQMILDIPRWDFDWQREYQLVTPLSFIPGDSVELTCSWNNTDANQPIVDGSRQAASDVVCRGVVAIVAGDGVAALDDARALGV